MGSVEEPPARPQADERDLLAARVIPTMTLSTATNPLTAPLPSNGFLDPERRAAARFEVEGTAIITGGAGFLGLVVARALLEHGAVSVALFDLPATLKGSANQINKLKTDFETRGQEILTCPVDVTSTTEVDQAVKRVATAVGRIDILFCLAGIVDCSHSLSADINKFSKVVDVNLTGSFICGQAVAKSMIEQKTGGSIVFTASISAHHTNWPQPQVAYNVSKAAVVQLTRNLAVEWAVHGIRVNCISPGYMDTVLNAGDNLKAIRDIWASNNPMGRIGDAEEITGPVIMLASKRAGRYISGADIVIDGGAMAL